MGSSGAGPGSRPTSFAAPTAPSTTTTATAAVPLRMPPPPKAPPVPASRLVVAQFDYAAQDADELALRKGCVVEVLDDSDGGWWRGKCAGKTGMFPANYVKPK